MRFIWIIVFLIPILGHSQRTEKEVIKFLTDDSLKLWYFDRYDSGVKGSDHNNESTYVFKNNGIAVINLYKDGKKVSKEFTFKLRKESNFDWWITVGPWTFYLVMTQLEEYHEVKLRTKTNGRIDETYDIILKYYTDDKQN